MDENTACYFSMALKYLLPLEPMEETGGFKISLGKKNYFFSGCNTPLNNSSSIQIARDKYHMNRILKNASIPVPRMVAITDREFREGKLKERVSVLNFPLVIKPRIGYQGRGVVCNIQNFVELQKYISRLFSSTQSIVIEEFHASLRSYRVLICNHKVVGVFERFPASVIGDGHSSIEDLIKITNEDRLKNNDHLSPIALNDDSTQRLNQLGINLEYVPKKNEEIKLRYVSNISWGGTFRSLGKKICNKNRRIFIKASQELNLGLVGFDVECEDINIPITNSQAVITDANHLPAIKEHEKPYEGTSTKVTHKVIQALIRRHPFAYLYILYKNPTISFYIKIFLVILVFSGLYFWKFLR